MIHDWGENSMTVGELKKILNEAPEECLSLPVRYFYDSAARGCPNAVAIDPKEGFVLFDGWDKDCFDRNLPSAVLIANVEGAFDDAD